MLKELIRDIRNTNTYPCQDCWRYRVSGNVLELSVLPQFTRNRSSYRCAVISIGQILLALSEQIEEVGSHVLIQSFPNIENPEVIASIRIEENNYNKPGSLSAYNNSPNGMSLSEVIQSVAEKFRLQVSLLNTLPDHIKPAGTDISALSYFAIRSPFDNPFAWLNIGYFKETLLKKRHEYDSNEQLLIYDFCADQNQQEEYFVQDENGFLQGYVVIVQ